MARAFMTDIRTRRCAVFLLIAALGLALDLGTKTWIFNRQGMPGVSPPIWLWQDILSLETSLNEGALFGMGQGKQALFVALSAVAVLGIGYWLLWGGAAHEWVLAVALGGITAGILGNLYDRLGLPDLKWHRPLGGHAVGDKVYAVRDWIHFQCPLFDWPIFNIADSLLVCGVAALVLHAYVLEPRRRKTSRGPDPAPQGRAPSPAPSEECNVQG
jgi:signal peptidase II